MEKLRTFIGTSLAALLLVTSLAVTAQATEATEPSSPTELAQNEAVQAFVDTGIPEALNVTGGEWQQDFSSIEENLAKAEIVILTNRGEEIILQQTTELAPDGRWLTSYEENYAGGTWNVTPAMVLERIAPQK